MDTDVTLNKFSERNWISEASEKLNVALKYHTSGQAVGSHKNCPVQFGDNVDRFVVFVEGNWWCRQCDARGWWGEKDEELLELQKKQKEKIRKEAFEKIHRCTEWKQYHENPQTFEQWMMQGFTEPEIKQWFLGYSSPCPCCPDFNSLTIPVWYKGQLWDIRHRLLGETENKYRSHLPGYPAPFFNLDSINADRDIFLVEGEKKSIKAISSGLKAVIGYPGLQFKKHIPHRINKYAQPGQRAIFIPDPGTIDTILSVVNEIQIPCYIVELWSKVDDLIIEHGTDTFLNLIKHPRRVK